MAINIIIKDNRGDSIKQHEDHSKKVIHDCYKQECSQESHNGRVIGDGRYSKSQIKKVWENRDYDRVLSQKKSV